ncbi:MAG: hypothetical protein ACP5SH_14925 [Syntrophobacteraceae bacterium]
MKSKFLPGEPILSKNPDPVNPVILSKVFAFPAAMAKDPDRITGLTG